MSDRWAGKQEFDGPATRSAAVTTHDTNPLTFPSRFIYVGGAGNITCRMLGSSSDVVFTAIAPGVLHRLRVSHIRATGTTATLIVALD